MTRIAIQVILSRWTQRTMHCDLLRVTPAMVYVRAPDGSTAAFERDSGRVSVARGGQGGGARRSSCLASCCLAPSAAALLWADTPYATEGT